MVANKTDRDLLSLGQSLTQRHRYTSFENRSTAGRRPLRLFSADGCKDSSIDRDPNECRLRRDDATRSSSNQS